MGLPGTYFANDVWHSQDSGGGTRYCKLKQAAMERDYHRACEACAAGTDCERPYEALDGTVYWCHKIFRPSQ